MQTGNKINLKTKRKLHITPLTVTIFVILTVYTISMILPLIWVFINSLKTQREYILDMFGFPSIIRWKNYEEVWEALHLQVWINGKIQYFTPIDLIGNTLIIAISAQIKDLLGQTQVAYILSKVKNKFTNGLWVYMIIMMFIPLGPSLVVSLKFAKWLGYWDNLWFYCLWGFGSFGGNTLLLYAAFKGLSDSYGEAAKVDGAGPFTVFAVIYFPMVFTLLATLFVLGMIGCWADYMTTTVWLPSYPSLGYGLFYFKGTAQLKGLGQPVVLAGYFITGMFSVLLYLSMQNVIITKLTVGTLKQ